MCQNQNQSQNQRREGRTRKPIATAIATATAIAIATGTCIALYCIELHCSCGGGCVRDYIGRFWQLCREKTVRVLLYAGLHHLGRQMLSLPLTN